MSQVEKAQGKRTDLEPKRGAPFKSRLKRQARAVRRCGELLAEVEKAQGGDRRNQKGGKSPLVSRKKGGHLPFLLPARMQPRTPDFRQTRMQGE